MKKHIIKLAALLLFTSVALTSCSLDYRERSTHRYDRNGHGQYGHDHYHYNDHHYDNRGY